MDTRASKNFAEILAEDSIEDEEAECVSLSFDFAPGTCGETTPPPSEIRGPHQEPVNRNLSQVFCAYPGRLNTRFQRRVLGPRSTVDRANAQIN